VVVAVVAVQVMQAAIHQKIEVVAVRHALMAAVLMTAGARDRSANIGIHFANGDAVFIIVALMRMVQMTIVQVVDMTLV
jgi:hypothetical protein